MKLPQAIDLIEKLAAEMRPQVTPDTALVGIQTGGVWVAQWLHDALGLTQPLGRIDVSLYRDDYHQRGLAARRLPSSIPFEVGGASIVIVDDVLYTGRTIRAALNELFDYGRPARVDLAVLIDRGGRELPVAATWRAHAMKVPAGRSIRLERAADGALKLVEHEDREPA